jgi:hypothetical protein
VVIASLGAAAPSARLDQLIRVRLIDGILQFEWIGARMPGSKSQYASGPEARWSVRAPRPIRGVAVGTIELERPAAGVRDSLSYWSIFVSYAPDRLYISGYRGGRAITETTLRFTQTPDGAVHLVVINPVTRTFTQARAASIVELRAQHPQLVRQTLVPLLRQISGDDPLLPGATDVYRVFTEVSPDSKTIDAVQALLPVLGDPAFATRERASARLEALGADAVCAALRLDLTQLLPEQSMRIERLLALHTHRAITDPQHARRDPAFLADCLEFDDDRVRWLARRELEQLIGRAIPMHHAPTPEEWSAAADVVRARLSQAAARSP